MQMIAELQSSWKERKLIGIDSIVFNNGNVLLIEINKTAESKAINTYGKLYELNIIKKTRLDILLEEDSDLWSEIQINGEINLRDKSKLFFGEGEMGNDGFIVKIDFNRTILWSLYSTTSNPFINFEIIDEVIHVFSSHGFSICIDEDFPSGLHLDNHYK